MSTQSYLFNEAPTWRKNRQGTRHTLPIEVQSWTYELGSLTQRLRNFYGNRVKVTVLFQGWQSPFLDERRLLKSPEHHYCLVREVMLHADNKPLILARTIIPRHTIKIAKSNLSHLGSRPLGEVIFSYPKLQRLNSNISLIQPNMWTELAREKGNIKEAIWGRSTVYSIAQREMLVSEFFLPEVLREG